MKITHITTTHSRSDSRVFKRQCVTLAENGHKLLYICCDGKPEETISGVKIQSYSNKKINKYQRYGFLFRPNNFAKYLFNLKSDIYQIHDFELLEVGYILAKNGCKVIFDSHENWFGMLINHFPSFKPLIRILLYKYYSRVLPKFSAIFSVSPNMVNDLSKYNANSYIVSNFPQIRNRKFEENVDYKKDNKFIYQGTVYSISNQEAIIKTFQDTTYKYLVVGNVEDSYKKSLIQLDNNDKTEFISWTSPENLDKIMNTCLAGIVILDYDPICCNKEGQLGSNKIFEYMLCGLPVICTDFELWKTLIIDKYKCGICVQPQDSKSIKAALDFLVNNKEEAFEMGRRGRDAILNEFNWETGIETYLEHYNKIVTQ